MLVCVWLVSSLIHMISGCSLSAPTEVTGYTGGSVVLTCNCTEGQPIPNNARWFFHHDSSYIELWPYPTTVNDRYKDRMIISATPGNLSLSLSDLTLTDGGKYSCVADGNSRDIRLTVKGCSLSAPKEVTGYTGGSVVLPCYCTEGLPTPNTAKWFFSKDSSNVILWSYSNEGHDQYKDRVIISTTPGNLSLHLSNLTLSDGGKYICEADGHNRYISLTVKGCSLSAPTEVTGYTGGSVVLPCYCTEGQPTPNTARWFFSQDRSSVILWSYPNEVHYQYKDRVIISTTPRNLSLHLSDLTLSDGGTYRCEADGDYKDIILTVKGCVLSGSKPINITGFTGDSVVLPCACTNVQKKPEWIRWTVHPGGQSTVIFSQSPPGVNDSYKHRVQVLDSVSPGNLSLHLSDLTLSDGGTYRCEADGNHRDISLTVIHRFDQLCLKV